MSDERPSELIQQPDYRAFVRLRDDRVGMSAQDLLDCAEEAFTALEEELAVLHRQLPRKSEARLKRTRGNRDIVKECIKGARARAKIAALGAQGLGKGSI